MKTTVPHNPNDESYGLHKYSVDIDYPHDKSKTHLIGKQVLCNPPRYYGYQLFTKPFVAKVIKLYQKSALVTILSCDPVDSDLLISLGCKTVVRYDCIEVGKNAS